jgi:hypothetical protein
LKNRGDALLDGLRDPSELYGIVNQKTALFTDIAVRTSDPTLSVHKKGILR